VKEQTACPFYGYHREPGLGVFIDQGGNECALRAPFAPCILAIRGNAPDIMGCAIPYSESLVSHILREGFRIVRGGELAKHIAAVDAARVG
jgi:hypothetical protein